MGKASKWIRNLFMGKREDKAKASFPPETTSTSTSLAIMVATTPKVRRRWSFKRPPCAKPITHKTSKSFDSIYMSNQLVHCEAHQALNANAAATRIQAAYRSYLARRALWALRALVKLQALARGYLVRKQMNTVLRSIHAVMAIQVRARIQRIQMGEEPPVVMGRRRSYTGPSSASDRQLGKEISVSHFFNFKRI